MPFARHLIAAMLGGALCATAAIAQEDENPAVEARQSQMHLHAFNLGILGRMAQGQAEYDAELAQVAADNLAVIAGTDWHAYFPEGTAVGEVDDTDALPEIWTNMADFEAKQQEMADAADAMAAVAGTDLAAVQGAMGALGGTCSACHKAYRQAD